MSLENELLMQANDNEIVLYQPNDAIRLEVRVEKDTVWLNRNQMSILFGRDVKTIGKHINNALQEELQGMATVAKFAIVHDEGGRRVTRTIDFYNSHDRFLLIDGNVYHIGASIKDLGKKWFAIMRMQEIKAEDIISHL